MQNFQTRRESPLQFERIRRRARRGNFLIIAALVMVILLGFGVLVIDVGSAQNSRAELQAASDASALTAVKIMDGTAAGLTSARTLAGTIASNNLIAGTPFALSSRVDATLDLGRWVNNAFVNDASNPALVVAARITGRRSTLPTFFAPLLGGGDTLAVRSSTVALGGGPIGAACPMPIAIPVCALPTGSAVCNYNLQLGPDGGDNGAWARIGGGRPSAQTVRSAISGCTNASTTSDTVSLNNGQIASASGDVAAQISNSSELWNTSAWGAEPAQANRSGVTRYGRVYHTAVIVFQGSAGSCNGQKYTGTGYPVLGFASGVAYDAVTTGPAAQRTISMRLVCETTQQVGGGRYFGARAPLALVQ